MLDEEITEFTAASISLGRLGYHGNVIEIINTFSLEPEKKYNIIGYSEPSPSLLFR